MSYEIADMSYKVGTWIPLLSCELLPDISGIYIIRDTVVGREYVGQSINIRSRLKLHLKTPYDRKYLYRAIKKHGAQQFECCVYLEAEPEELAELEKMLVEERGTLAPKGYNMTVGGEGTLGYKHSESTKAAISQIVKQKIKDFGGEVPWRERGLEASRRLWSDPVSRAKMIEICRSRPPISESTKQKHRDVHASRSEDEKRQLALAAALANKNFLESPEGVAYRIKTCLRHAGGGNPKAKEVIEFPENSFVGVYHTCIKDVAAKYSTSRSSITRWIEGSYRPPSGAFTFI